ncbi:phage recombination protein Bet [Mesorhizobium sp. M0088]|uniref:phage recombination protein Bet n=1 Tax=Mesorhizobium sp. M0088 TaxID=2956873 RepID=UPI003337CD31
MNAVATLNAPSMPLAPAVAEEFSLTLSDWRVLVDQIFPSAKSGEAVAMALAYCRSRKLDIYKKPVHIVPMWSSALNRMVETVWPGISEIRTTAARTGDYGGIDEVVFGPMIEREFTGEKDKWENKRKVGTEVFTKKFRYPEWASVIVYRWVHGEKAAFHTKIFWEETYATVGKTEVPNEMWTKRPRGQIDKCVEAACLRKAFPEEVGSMYAAEEMEGRVIDHDASERTSAPQPPKPPVPPVPPSDKVVDAEVEEIIDEREVVTETGEATDAIVDETETLGDYFTKLDETMGAATTAADIAEIWNDFDPLAKFEGDEDNQALATSIKRKHVQRVGAK